MALEKELKNFLVLSYDELESLNLSAKERQTNASEEELRQYYSQYLAKQSQIKAVTICFSDLEGRFHMLDYDKRFFLTSSQNLTFDGSSIHGFTQVDSSDLRLDPDWGSFRWLPTDVFGPGKVIMFAFVRDKDGSLYAADMRSQLKVLLERLRTEHGLLTNLAVECEGFLLEGINAEQNFDAAKGFTLVSSGGYFSSLPRDPLKQFIDAFADAKRAVGLENEKDHPEVAPSQFELNFKYCDALIAADQLQLYKLIARQVAANMGMTASFLPKPVAGINGSGMHTNMSLSRISDGRNVLYDAAGREQLSSLAWDMVNRLLYSANDLSLILNPSVNAYRRQDPAFEAPNQIKASANDRTSMVRLPLGNEQSARLEVRTVAPDANPYMVFLTLLKIAMHGPYEPADTSKRNRTRFLPDNIHDAIRHFKASDIMAELLGVESRDKYMELKTAVANRCPRDLGTKVKGGEVLFHHEVTNQYLWAQF